ncbi:MAG TPA: hypothetical protein PKI62_08770 [bacterium]|nr:hypothetical protein [bacterium]HPR86542.1 hypothetical protein [bacterium]
MSEQQRHDGCPGTRELELFCIGELAAVRNKALLQTHLKECPRCAKKLHHLHTFYTLFAKELDRPVRPALLDFCKKRAYTSVKYGLLVCRPVPEKDRRMGKAYLATLAFSANGNGSKRSLVDYELSSDQIGIMLYSDPQHHEILLFLWGQGDGRSAPCELDAPGLFAKAEFTPAGAARIPLTDFEHLNNRLLYFYTQSRSRSRRRLLARVQEMVA